jgi:hypothetical protein
MSSSMKVYVALAVDNLGMRDSQIILYSGAVFEKEEDAKKYLGRFGGADLALIPCTLTDTGMQIILQGANEL